MPKICDFCQNFKGWEGGQHEQHFVKNKFVKNMVGGREVNLNLDNVHKYTGFFWTAPISVEKINGGDSPPSEKVLLLINNVSFWTQALCWILL